MIKQINQLMDDYAKAALENDWNLYNPNGTVKQANAAMDELIKISKKFSDMEDQGRNVYIQLLNHPELVVRYWAAVDLFPVDRVIAEPILEEFEFADPPYHFSGNAKYALIRLREEADKTGTS